MTGHKSVGAEERAGELHPLETIDPDARDSVSSERGRGPRVLERLRRMLVVPILAGSLAWLTVLIFVRWGTEPRPWPIEFLDTFALYAFVPMAALIPASFLLRSRALAALALIAGLTFVQQFGPAVLSKATFGAPAGPLLRVLTYNVYSANARPAELAALVRSVEPDVIVLQELRQSYAAELVGQIGEAYPYRVGAALNTANDGSGTFSRLPIIEAQAFLLREDGNAFQRLRLQFGDREIALFNVHLATPEIEARRARGRGPRLVRGYETPERDGELAWLIEETQPLSTPFVLAGDFNLAAGSRPYRQFPERWRDAFSERGWGFGHTWPARRVPWSVPAPVWTPLIRIDYVLSSPELAPTRAWVPWLDGSDHLPVVAELRLAGAEQDAGRKPL